MKRTPRRNKMRQAAQIFLNGLLFKNPVLIGALGLFPVVAAGYSLQNGLALSILMLVIMVPVCMISCWIGTRIRSWLRPAIVLLLCAVFYIPAAWIALRMFPETEVALTVYGSLMVCNSAILSRANDYAPRHVGFAVFADSVGCAVGFGVVICIFSAVREFLAYGTVGGVIMPLPSFPRSPAALPFYGLILLGFCAALVQWITLRADKKKGRVKRG